MIAGGRRAPASFLLLLCAANLLAGAWTWSAFASRPGLLATALLAGFLLLIAMANLVLLRTGWQRFRAVRRGEVPEPDSTAPAGGPIAALLRIVRKTWHMYPIGFLFGLGFDTATEVGLIGISATQVTEGLPAWQILVFPVLFTAGMTLVVSADSILMTGVYGWAGQQELRRLWYNLSITAASAVMALLIGGIETAGLLAGKIGPEGGLWRVIAALNDNGARLGMAIVAAFLGAWALSAFVNRCCGRADCRMPVR